jgi:hypothetical protein
VTLLDAQGDVLDCQLPRRECPNIHEPFESHSLISYYFYCLNIKISVLPRVVANFTLKIFIAIYRSSIVTRSD